MPEVKTSVSPFLRDLNAITERRQILSPLNESIERGARSLAGELREKITSGVPREELLSTDFSHYFETLLRKAGFFVGEVEGPRTIIPFEHQLLFRRFLFQISLLFRTEEEVRLEDEYYLGNLKERLWKGLKSWLESKPEGDVDIRPDDLNAKIQELLELKENASYRRELQEDREAFSTLILVLSDKISAMGFNIVAD